MGCEWRDAQCPWAGGDPCHVWHMRKADVTPMFMVLNRHMVTCVHPMGLTMASHKHHPEPSGKTLAHVAVPGHKQFARQAGNQGAGAMYDILTPPAAPSAPATWWAPPCAWQKLALPPRKSHMRAPACCWHASCAAHIAPATRPQPHIVMGNQISLSCKKACAKYTGGMREERNDAHTHLLGGSRRCLGLRPCLPARGARPHHLYDVGIAQPACLRHDTSLLAGFVLQPPHDLATLLTQAPLPLLKSPDMFGKWVPRRRQQCQTSLQIGRWRRVSFHS